MLLDHIDRHARERGDATALRWFPSGATLSWRDLHDVVRARAARLRALGLHGDPVLLFGANDPTSVISFLGAMAAGLTPSFMPLPAARFDAASYWMQHRALFSHIGRGAVIAPDDALPGLAEACPDNPLTLIATESLEGQGEAGQLSALDPDAVALLQHSSGTTGVKKGVALSYRAIEAQVAAYREALDFGPDAVVASWLPLYHDMGLIACLVLPLSTGAQTVYLDPFRWTAAPQTLFDAIEAVGATHVWLPNFAFRHLERAVRRSDRRWALGSVRAWINCSEPCKPAAFDAFLTRYADHGVTPAALACCYAMAETVFAVSQTRPGAEPARVRVTPDGYGEPGQAAVAAGPDEVGIDILSCGPPIPGCQVRIEGADRDGVYGQILVSADFLFDGYFRDPDRTARVLREGWYATGDVGFIRDGELYVCGRVDDRIIVGGRNLYAHEIEQLVSAVPGVVPGRAVAMGVYDEAGGTERLVIAAEFRDGESPAAIAARVIEAIDAGMSLRPGDVRLFTDRRIIKTTSGKLDRKKNAERYLSGGFT